MTTPELAVKYYISDRYVNDTWASILALRQGLATTRHRTLDEHIIRTKLAALNLYCETVYPELMGHHRYKHFGGLRFDTTVSGAIHHSREEGNTMS